MAEASTHSLEVLNEMKQRGKMKWNEEGRGRKSNAIYLWCGKILYINKSGKRKVGERWSKQLGGSKRSFNIKFEVWQLGFGGRNIQLGFENHVINSSDMDTFDF